MDVADVESAEEIKVGNTGRIDSFYICGQVEIDLTAFFMPIFNTYQTLSERSPSIIYLKKA
ncbi:hypothetical protein [Oribacterium sp. NK2B42]|uniref:hypothetical protein n=1 Tax=Oribacterium sp. NK2B42 TaxID=689781 RepID=UPI0012EC0DF6|nr:hypothetical protein [Oribacterium sp. NK2B42]